MAWMRMKVFKCNLCGDFKPLPVPFDGCMDLPPNWHGSGKKGGDCYCGRCYRKLMSQPVPPNEEAR